MATLLMLLTVVLGLFLLPGFPFTGIALIALGLRLRAAAAHDEDFFMGLMSTLAGLGAIVFTVRGILA